MTTAPRVAVVLGSGGMKCAAAVGLWKVLHQAGIEADLHVGCSGGSIYATAMAMGHDVRQAEEQTLVMWEQALGARVRTRSVFQLLLPRLFNLDERFGLLDDGPLWEVMTTLYGSSTFDDLRHSLQLVATDLRSGERVLITEGRLADAVRASVSLPLIFPPWQVGERLLIDGGATDPLPLSVAIREGADLIISMGFENPLQERLDSIRALVGQTSNIAMNSLTRSTFSFYNAAHHAEIIPVIPLFDGNVTVRDAARIPELIREGERATREVLPHIERSLEAIHAGRVGAGVGMAEAIHG